MALLYAMPVRADSEALRLEILTHINASAPEPPGEAEQEMFLRAGDNAQKIRGFLHGFDRYASYLTPEEYRGFLQTRRDFSYGVGMDLVRDRTNRIICIPYPGSQARKGGIAYGDQLLEVDGYAVKDLDMEDVGVLVRGNTGSEVLLKTLDQDGKERLARFKRGELPGVTASLENSVHGMPRIRIHRFGRHTGRELRRIIEQLGFIRGLVLDLRGNIGGDLRAAVACAALFRPKGACLLHIKDKAGERRDLSKTDGDWRHVFVRVWQDDLTASAAEVLIVALTESVSIGTTSAGKARVQETFRLQNGGILKLTVAELFHVDAAQGWQDNGLSPNFKTTGLRQSDADFIRLTPPLEDNANAASLQKTSRADDASAPLTEQSPHHINH